MLKLLRNLKPAAIIYSFLSILAWVTVAQSTDQSFPTPVRNNEISGVVKARDLGDSRLTSYYYTFEGGQGDLFINVQTANFSGDVDIFAVPGLRPLTKMVIYADTASSETGRVIYLRKPETILLRIQGRTPGDEEASYRIKFAGSFLASKSQDNTPEVPKVASETQTSVRVNSVGTILEAIPKATPAPKEEAASPSKEVASEPVPQVDENKDAETAKTIEEPKTDDRPTRSEVVITDPLAEKEKPEADKSESNKAPAKRESRPRRNSRREAEARKDQEVKADDNDATDQKDSAVPADEAVAEKEPERPKNAKSERPKPVDPMAGIRLVIRFKNGGVIERPMTDVSKFTVERAVLTVINKNGTVGRYQMIEVAGVTIE